MTLFSVLSPLLVALAAARARPASRPAHTRTPHPHTSRQGTVIRSPRVPPLSSQSRGTFPRVISPDCVATLPSTVKSRYTSIVKLEMTVAHLSSRHFPPRIRPWFRIGTPSRTRFRRDTPRWPGPSCTRGSFRPWSRKMWLEEENGNPWEANTANAMPKWEPLKDGWWFLEGKKPFKTLSPFHLGKKCLFLPPLPSIFPSFRRHFWKKRSENMLSWISTGWSTCANKNKICILSTTWVTCYMLPGIKLCLKVMAQTFPCFSPFSRPPIFFNNAL